MHKTEGWRAEPVNHGEARLQELGVFIPIGNNGWLISNHLRRNTGQLSTSMRDRREAERFGFDFCVVDDQIARFLRPVAVRDYNWNRSR